MGIRETLRLAGEDPLYLVRAAKRGQLEALRAALATRMPAGTDVNQIAFDDAAEPDFAPRDQAGICRRLYHNRLGLNLSARIESRSKWRLLATAVAGLAGTIAIASIGGEGRTELQIAVERAISAGAGLLAIGGGGWLAWLALGLSPRAHAMTMPESVLNEADLEDANAFARRALIRELPDGVPADLADTYRPLTIDAEGRAAEGQVIAQDLVESYAVEAASGRQLILGIASLGVLLAGFGALSDSALLSGLASGVAITSAVIAALRLFVLPDVAERRAIAGHEAREASPLAKLVQETGEAQGKQIEAARVQQLANAMADKSAFIQIGVSTGLLAERRDPFAPSAAGMPFGLTAADLSTHALVFGDTGSGKTSGVLRPVIAGWTARGRDGLVILDGKGALPAEMVGLPGFKIISPEHEILNPIEHLTGDEVADCLAAMFASKDAADPYWDRASTKLIRAGAVVLELVSKIDGSPLRYNLGSLYRLLFLPDSLNQARDLIVEYVKSARAPTHVERAWEYLTIEFPALPERTRGSIQGNASVWLSTLVDNAKLAAWADAETGVQIESALTGGRLGLLLPEATYGQAGAAVSNFVKARLYKRLKQRDADWKSKVETPVLLVIDECQALLTRDESAMLPIARSLGLHALFATQNLDGIVAAMGGSSKATEAEQLLGQFRSIVSLSVSTQATREFVSARMGTVPRARYSQIPTATGDSAGTAAGLLRPASGHAPGTVVGDAAISSEAIHGLRKLTGFAGQASAAASEAMEKVGLGGFRDALGGLLGNRQAASMSVGVSAVVSAEEVTLLTAQPDHALVSVQRGRVVRRDLVALKPIYSFAQSTAADGGETRPKREVEEVAREYA